MGGGSTDAKGVSYVQDRTCDGVWGVSHVGCAGAFIRASDADLSGVDGFSSGEDGYSGLGRGIARGGVGHLCVSSSEVHRSINQGEMGAAIVRLPDVPREVPMWMMSVATEITQLGNALKADVMAWAGAALGIALIASAAIYVMRLLRM